MHFRRRRWRRRRWRRWRRGQHRQHGSPWQRLGIDQRNQDQQNQNRTVDDDLSPASKTALALDPASGFKCGIFKHGQPRIGCWLLLFRHRGTCKCSRHQNGTTEVCSTYIRTAQQLPNLHQKWCNRSREFTTLSHALPPAKPLSSRASRATPARPPASARPPQSKSMCR